MLKNILWTVPSHRQNKGGSCVGTTKIGKGSKIMAIADTTGLPITIDTGLASSHKVTLVEQTIEARFIAEIPDL